MYLIQRYSKKNGPELLSPQCNDGTYTLREIINLFVPGPRDPLIFVFERAPLQAEPDLPSDIEEVERTKNNAEIKKEIQEKSEEDPTSVSERAVTNEIEQTSECPNICLT